MDRMLARASRLWRLILSKIFLRYVLFGAPSYVVGLLCFVACVNYLKLDPLFATTLSAWVAYGTSWGMHKWFTFKKRRLQTAGWELPVDLAIKLFWNAVVVSPLLILFFTEVLEYSPITSQALIQVVLGVQNFFWRRYLVFIL